MSHRPSKELAEMLASLGPDEELKAVNRALRQYVFIICGFVLAIVTIPCLTLAYVVYAICAIWK